MIFCYDFAQILALMTLEWPWMTSKLAANFSYKLALMGTYKTKQISSKSDSPFSFYD